MDDTQGVVKDIMRDFIPMFQGILETFLQAKQEALYVKQTDEICCLMPAKLKHLLDLLPSILTPLLDVMESNQHEQVASGIHTVQYWLSALAHFPELLDPLITSILPELNQSLKLLLHFMPNLCLKLLGKLGSKSR